MAVCFFIAENSSDSALLKSVQESVLSTYSHYENDEIRPDLFTMSVFPERMGLDTSHINFVCSKAELLISAIRSEIQKNILAGNFQEAERLIEQYKAVRINHGSRLHDQYLLLQRGIIAEIQGKYHEAAELFLEGMALTNVSLSNLRSRYLLSRQEFELIYRYSSIKLNSSSEFKVIYSYLNSMDDSDLLKKKYFAVCAYRTAELSLNERDSCSALSYVLSGISYQQKIYQIINIDRGLSLKKKIINLSKRCLNDEEGNILDYSLIIKKIYERYSVSFSSDIIKLSKPDFDGLNIPESAILNETEMELLNGLAISYQYIGRIDSAGRIWKQLSDYMDKCFVVNAGKIKYRILVNYSNVLGLSQKYEECIGVCIKGIRMLCSEVTQNVIYNFVFNIGWCLCYKNMNSENRGKYKKGIRYIDAAINLCRYFDESKSSLDTMIETKKTLADKL